ncbi:hypothetical protein [Aeromicrobium sp. CF3.5]|uniref:hypothetical protein n=1 Tax=Aeromicrobium sp. CF3.5 TaxID=3373078 RepID=UPI003EE605D2
MAERTARSQTAHVRTLLARALQLACTAIAVILALGALFIAVRGSINNGNSIVEFVTDVAGFFDGPLARQDGIFAFSGDGAITKNALLNWGLAAIVWIIIGRIASLVVRP